MKWSRSIVAGVVLTLAGLAASPAPAQQIDGFGQFIVSKLSGDAHGEARGRFYVGNPMSEPVFALAVVFRPDGHLRDDFGDGGCLGLALAPHGGSPVHMDQDTDLHTVQVVSVRSSPEDPLAGRFGDDLQQVGVYLNGINKTRGHAVLPSIFGVPEGEDKAKLGACACRELRRLELDTTLIDELPISCGDG